MELPRRHFLLLISGALLQPVTDRVQRDMVVRSVRPEDLEMPLSGFSDYITPIDHFFVRTHVYTPRVTTNEWRLTVDGAVATPLTLTMDDVSRLPVVERVGVKESAKEVLFNGADVPLGTMPDFQRSIPIGKALDARTLLAYEMNGETLPMKHGFPLRAVAPGWA